MSFTFLPHSNNTDGVLYHIVIGPCRIMTFQCDLMNLFVLETVIDTYYNFLQKGCAFELGL